MFSPFITQNVTTSSLLYHFPHETSLQLKYSSLYQKFQELFGAGVRSGVLARFPIYLIDPGELPITIPTAPLLMVYGGDLKWEKEIVRFVIKHRLQLNEYIEFLSILHAKALKEVLGNMNIENLRELELDMPAITDLFDVMIRTIGSEKAIETIGPEKVIEKIGLERIIQTAGIEKIEELLKKAKQDKVK